MDKLLNLVRAISEVPPESLSKENFREFTSLRLVLVANTRRKELSYPMTEAS